MIKKSARELMSDALSGLEATEHGSTKEFAFDGEETYRIFVDRLKDGLVEMARTASNAQPFATRFLTQTASAKPFGLQNVADVDHVAAGGVTTTATLCYPEGTDPADTD